jgi:hypothetical protein
MFNRSLFFERMEYHTMRFGNDPQTLYSIRCRTIKNQIYYGINFRYILFGACCEQEIWLKMYNAVPSDIADKYIYIEKDLIDIRKTIHPYDLEDHGPGEEEYYMDSVIDIYMQKWLKDGNHELYWVPVKNL